MPYTLDDYQRYTANKASRDIIDNGGSLLVAPTGTGKSVMGSYVALNLFTNRKINRVCDCLSRTLTPGMGAIYAPVWYVSNDLKIFHFLELKRGLMKREIFSPNTLLRMIL